MQLGLGADWGNAMRVLMVTRNLLIGGEEMTALRLVRALVPMGYEFTLASIGGQNELGEEFCKAGAQLYKSVGRFRFDPLAVLRIARIIRKNKIDVVIVLGVPRNALFYALTGAFFSGRAVGRLCWCNSDPAGQSGKFARQLRMYRALKMLDAVICASRTHRKMLTDAGLDRRRLIMIRTCVAPECFADPHEPASISLSLPAGKKIVVQVANVMPDKDHQTLLRAAGILTRSRDDFHLVLVGLGTDSPEMLQSVRDAGLENTVTLAGRIDNVTSLLAAADIFVLSTKREVFNVATLEALAAGLPVIVSNIEAFDEMFTHNVQGLKFPPGNPDALAQSITSLLDNPARTKTLSQAAKTRAQTFTLKKMAQNFHKLLKVFKK